MKAAAIIDVINDLEERYAVDEWTVGGLQIWPYLRLKLGADLFRIYHTKGENSTNRLTAFLSRGEDVIKGIARFGYASLADYKQNRWPLTPADLVMVSDGVSFTKLNGVWYEKFCDPLMTEFSKRNLSSFMLTPGRDCLIPRATPSLFIQPALDAAMSRGLYGGSSCPVSQSFLAEYSDYSNSVRAHGVEYSTSSDWVCRVAKAIRTVSNYFRFIFERITPSLVCVVSYQGIEGMAVNLACRELGIHSVDLQHGLQGNLNAAYARWQKVPRTGFALLPSVFWCWSEADAAVISKWTKEVTVWHQPIAGGEPVDAAVACWLSGRG